MPLLTNFNWPNLQNCPNVTFNEHVYIWITVPFSSTRRPIFFRPLLRIRPATTIFRSKASGKNVSDVVSSINVSSTAAFFVSVISAGKRRTISHTEVDNENVLAMLKEYIPNAHLMVMYVQF